MRISGTAPALWVWDPAGDPPRVDKTIHSEAQRRLSRMLKAKRVLAGLRQEELAEALGVSQTWISNVEVGERRVDVVELDQMCEALGTTLVEFVKEFKTQGVPD